MRLVGLPASLLALGATAACSLHVDYSGTQFRCDEGGVCPTGQVCLEGLCTPEGLPAQPDASPAVPDAPPGSPDAPSMSTEDTVSVPAGTFTMGCNLERDPDCDADELPPHAVTLSAFEIHRTEVSQGDYARCVTAGLCETPSCDWDPVARARKPVVCVSWSDARDYCLWAGMRLPTEAEFEKAARGTDQRVYPWGNQAPTCVMANYQGCGGVAKDVDTLPQGASPYGALHMSGNVAEWVHDYYAASYYTSSPAQDPQGPATGTDRQTRGGSFTIGPTRAGDRFSINPAGEASHRGFRCARSL